MKKLESCKKRIVSQTPWYAKILQGLSIAIAFIPEYITSLPQVFQDSIPVEYYKWITLSCIIIALLLQLLNKNNKRK